MRKELTVQEWAEELDDAQRYREEFGHETDWPMLEDLFYDRAEHQTFSAPNIISSTGDAMLSELVVPNPRIRAKPLQYSSVNTAPVVQAVDNMILGFAKIPAEFETLALHAYMWGVGIGKIGYDSEWGYSPENDFMDLGMSLSQFDKKGNKIEYGFTDPGMPWFKAVPPHDILVPWGSGPDIDTIPWIAHRVFRHVEDLKADPKYDTKNLKPQISLEDATKSYSSIIKPWIVSKDNPRGFTREASYVELWEIHDKRTGKIYVVSSGHDKFLRNEKNYLQLGRLPFISLRFVPSARSFWVPSDARYLLVHQNELMDIALQNKKERRSRILKLLYSKDAISETELARLESADSPTALGIEGGHSLRESVMEMPRGTSAMLWQESEVVRRDARELVGFSRNQLGEFDTSSRRTATESAIVNQNSDQRMSRRHVKIAEAYQQTFEKINDILFEFWRAPQIIQVTAGGRTEWTKFTGQGLKGRYQLSISMSQEPPVSFGNDRQSVIGLLQVLSAIPGVDLMPILEMLKDTYDEPYINAALRNVQNATVSSEMQQSEVRGEGPAMATNGGVGAAGRQYRTHLLITP